MDQEQPYSSSALRDDVTLREAYLQVLERGRTGKLDANMNRLRELVVCHGLPAETAEEARTGKTLRGKVWFLLLRAKGFFAADYLRWVNMGPSSSDGTIILDSNRTFGGDKAFKLRVTQQKMIRLLNTFYQSLSEKDIELQYIQGLTQWAGVLLYVMPELDAYSCMCRLVRHYCQTYCIKDIPGCFHAIELFGKILKHADPELASYLEEHRSTPNTYALQALLMLNCNGTSITEVLKLWDMSIALGMHMQVVFAVARVMLMRVELMEDDQPSTLLGISWRGELDGNATVSLGLNIFRSLPLELHYELMYHLFVP